MIDPMPDSGRILACRIDHNYFYAEPVFAVAHYRWCISYRHEAVIEMHLRRYVATQGQQACILQLAPPLIYAAEEPINDNVEGG